MKGVEKQSPPNHHIRLRHTIIHPEEHSAVGVHGAGELRKLDLYCLFGCGGSRFAATHEGTWPGRIPR